MQRLLIAITSVALLALGGWRMGGSIAGIPSNALTKLNGTVLTKLDGTVLTRGYP